jgi:hypothetical protein
LRLGRGGSKSEAPETIIATRYQDDDPTTVIVARRPRCPYPAVARFSGKGEYSLVCGSQQAEISVAGGPCRSPHAAGPVRKLRSCEATKVANADAVGGFQSFLVQEVAKVSSGRSRLFRARNGMSASVRTPVPLAATLFGPLSAEAVSNTMNFCDRSREANFFVIYPILSGLRARKSEQNRAV